MKFKYFSLLLFVLISCASYAQNLTQTVRGIIIDKISNEPLIGAVVTVTTSNPVIGSVSDFDGNFKLLNVPVGRNSIAVQMLGYKPIMMNDVLVNSGKELVLNVPMDEEINQTNEVTISADQEKKKPLNSMAGVSARTFSVEETQKFAAAVNDPSRMAISFAGVVSGDDGNNLISIRGNSPYGLLWRMEGVEIPNPNHFGGVATSGGGISILSSQLLGNSDFFTGAFPAEYGNALSGVFDMKLRKGNNEKHEFTFQAGFLGLDAAIEGPFKKGYAGSYLINYRYSTLSVLGKLGVPIGDATTNFQDLAFNIYLPSERLGNFQLFGFGGLSSQIDKADRDTSLWEMEWQHYDSRYYSNTGAGGLRHVINISENTYLQSSAVLSGNFVGYEQEKLSFEFDPVRDYEEKHTNQKLLLTTVLNNKFNARNSLRSGFYYSINDFSLLKEFLNEDTDHMETGLDASGGNTTAQAFSQWKFRVNERLTLNSGVHFLYLPMNNTSSVEPRFSTRYQLDENKTLSLGYGLHGQVQPTGMYKTQVLQPNGTYSKPNENLGMNKSHHMVLGYEQALNKFLYLKTELYYQHLFNIAVGADSGSTLSSLNNVENYITEPLNNKGKGRNYGAELTLEQYMHNNMYFLLSASLFNSEFMTADQVWRNTRFNANYAVSFTAGKEWKVGKEGKNKTLGVNLRAIYRGGMRTTPINMQASIAEGSTVIYEDQLYEAKVADYFRTDLKFSLRRNRAHSTSTLALDFQNATNRKNVWNYYFDASSGTIKTSYQTPLIPVLSYKIEF